MENKKQLKEIILQIGIEQAESILVELKKESLSQNKDTEAREFLIGIFNQMKVRVEKDCPNSVFYDVDELGTVFEQDAKNKVIWVSFKCLWTVMQLKLGYGYQQIQLLTTGVVEDVLNWKGYTLNGTPQMRGGWKTS